METIQPLHSITLRWLKLIIQVTVSIVLLLILLFLEQTQQTSQAVSPNDFSCAAVSGIPVAECNALVTLYNNTGGASWITKTGWLTTNTPCNNWHGISCASEHVSIIELGNNQLTGTIPSQLGELTQLQKLYLSKNQLSGTIPSQLGTLTELIDLYLDDNKLSGGTPPELSNLTKLQQLFLNDNLLEGNIPADLRKLTKLEKLRLINNQLSGSIPPELGELKQLQELRLSNNQLSGSIPPQLNTLAALNELYLDHNKLTGTIPIELLNLPNLQYLQLDDNKLSGGIPPELSNLKKLKRLFLNNNPLEGNIPADLSNLEKLEQLHLSNNQLSGSIPPELGGLKELKELYLFENQLSGSIPPELGRLTKLQQLHLSNNQLSGTIPPQLNMLAALNDLYLDHNKLTGTIPIELLNLPNLQYLQLDDNKLSGGIPPELGNLTGLRRLFLNNNPLEGNIPADLSNLTKLEQLHLFNNQLSGSIPPELGKLTKLRELYLFDNQLSGSIPPELGGLVELVQLLLNSNQLTGDIPSTFSKSNFPNLNVLRLRYNMLSCEGQACSFADGLDADWQRFQTVPPTNQHLLTQTATSVDLGWTPISYRDDGGGYEVAYATQPGGPFVVHGITPDKNAFTYTVDNLCPNQTYYFAVRSYTPHHNEQQNDLRSSFSQSLKVTTLVDQSSLKVLAIYLLAFDNNLSEAVDSILQEIKAATADPSSCRNKAALVLADQKGDGDTKAYFIQSGSIVPRTDFPDQETNRPDPNRHEYNMTDGTQLGAFIQWGRQQYSATQTILSFVGHGLPLVPTTDIPLVITDSTNISSADTSNIFPLPIKKRIYVHAQYDQMTDMTSKSLISPYALAVALKIGTDGGQNPLTVLDIVHCFSGTIEEFYEVSPYAQALIGAPNYTYSNGKMLGRALLAIQPGQSARYMAEAMIDSYDQTFAEADSFDGEPLTVEHPRVLVALQSDRLSVIKASMDHLAKALIDAIETERKETKGKISAAQNSSQKYDTTLCSKQDSPQDWALSQDDALSDMADFLAQLKGQFAQSESVALTAEDVISQVNAAVIKTISVSGTPWFAQAPELQWEFRKYISGIGLYTDFHGTHSDGDISLGWQTHWYNKGNLDPHNPHPLTFLQGNSVTWSDVLADFWSNQNGIQTIFCTVEFPKIKPAPIATTTAVPPTTTPIVTPTSTVTTTARPPATVPIVTPTPTATTTARPSATVPAVTPTPTDPTISIQTSTILLWSLLLVLVSLLVLVLRLKR